MLPDTSGVPFLSMMTILSNYKPVKDCHGPMRVIICILCLLSLQTVHALETGLGQGVLMFLMKLQLAQQMVGLFVGLLTQKAALCIPVILPTCVTRKLMAKPVGKHIPASSMNDWYRLLQS